LENSEIDLDTKTDETDCEAILCDLEDIESSENNDQDARKNQASPLDEDNTLEMRYAPMLAELTRMKRAESLATLQELVARDPGRAQKLHLKQSKYEQQKAKRTSATEFPEDQTAYPTSGASQGGQISSYSESNGEDGRETLKGAGEP
jgi:hypothetical protein